MQPWARSAALSAAGLWALGCFDFSLDNCNSDSDCPSGQVCERFFGSSCEPGCRNDSDCGFNHLCAGPGGFSFGPDTCIEGCATNDNCPAHSFCPQDESGDVPKCARGCHDDGECRSGTVCSTAGACEMTCDHAADPRCDGGLVCVAGEIGRPDTCREGCLVDDDCSSDSFCKRVARGPAQCTVGCRDDDGCPPDAFCAAGTCTAGCRDDHGCAAGSWCENGACTLPKFTALATDETNVYYVKEGAGLGEVAAVPKAGGAPISLASGLEQPYAVAVDATFVYWTSGGPRRAFGSSAAGGAVMKAPLAGGAATTMVSGLGCPTALAIDATNAYWLEGNAVWKSPIEGGPAVRLTPPPPSCDGCQALDLCVFAPSARTPRVPDAIAVDGTSIYFTDWFTVGSFSLSTDFGSGDGRLLKVPVTGGEVTELAVSHSSLSSVAVDGDSAYFISSGTFAPSFNGALMKVSIAGGTLTTLLGPLCSPFGVAVHGANAYWSDTCGVELGRIPIAGGLPVEVVPRGTHEPSGALVTDGEAVFLTDSTPLDRRVLMVPIEGGAPTVLVSFP